MKKNDKKQSVIIKVAHGIGSRTVGRCYIWYNQPKVPEKLKNEVEQKGKR